MRVSVLLFALVLGCRGAGQGIGTRTTTLATAPSGKVLAIYRSPTFETEAKAEVPEDVVVQSLRASSMFFEEDIRSLAPQIVSALAKLEDDERVVVETNDTAVHLYVAAGTSELQIVAFRQGQEISRHASALPSAAVKTELAVKPQPAPTPATPRAADAPVQAPPPPATEPAKPPEPVATKPATETKKPRTDQKKPKPAAPKLSEAEIRTKLDELERLRTKGLINEDEYKSKRTALLDQL